MVVVLYKVQGYAYRTCLVRNLTIRKQNKPFTEYSNRAKSAYLHRQVGIKIVDSSLSSPTQITSFL